MVAPTARRPGLLHAFTGLDVPELLRIHGRARSGDAAVIWDDNLAPAQTWTYGDLARRVAQTAGGLSQAGVGAGDVVLLHMSNRPEFLLAYFGCLWLGAVPVTTNTRSSPSEIAYFAAHSGARFAITEAELLPALRAGGHVFAWIAATGPAGDGVRPLADMIEAAAPAPERAVDPMAIASVQYTSGTTSRPKGVVFTHANILWGGAVSAGHEQIGPDDRTLIIAPLFHVNALLYSLMASLWVGGAAVLTPRFSRSAFWSLVERHGCTWLSLVPFALRALLTEPIPNNPLRFLGLGAADVPWVEQPFEAECLGWWGMTETVSHGVVSRRNMRNRPMSMGAPALEYELKIVDADGREIAPHADGARGRLMIRGVCGLSMFLEYLHDPQATAAAFDADGWFDTGDIVVAFADGQILFGDRDKDMLRVGSENVAASEIERVIAQVEGVLETAVVGRPHPMLDEVPVAFVIARPGVQPDEAAILAHCRDHLADFKVPRQVIFVDELPRSLLDKVAKAELRARLREPA